MSLLGLVGPFLMGLFGHCELWDWGLVSRSDAKQPLKTSLKGHICLCSWSQLSVSWSIEM